MDSAGLFTGESRLEQHFRATGNVRNDSDDVSVWENVGLLLVKFRGRFVLCVVIQANVAQFLADITNNLALSGGSERVTLAQ